MNITFVEQFLMTHTEFKQCVFFVASLWISSALNLGALVTRTLKLTHGHTVGQKTKLAIVVTHAIGRREIQKQHIMMKCYAINVDTNVASVLHCESNFQIHS